MPKSELLVAEQVERTDFSSADICSAKPPAVPEAVKRHRKPPEGRVLQGFHEPPPKSVTVSKKLVLFPRISLDVFGIVGENVGMETPILPSERRGRIGHSPHEEEAAVMRIPRC